MLTNNVEKCLDVIIKKQVQIFHVAIGCQYLSYLGTNNGVCTAMDRPSLGLCSKSPLHSPSITSRHSSAVYLIEAKMLKV